MKILIHSNGPNVATGYGVQTALLAERLKRDGHDVAISAYYGQQGSMGTFQGTIPVLPCAGDAYGNVSLPQHALRFFEGDPLGGWIITIMDVFGLQNPELANFNVAAWTPVDHEPCPKAVRQFFTLTDAVPIAMSQWGQKSLQRAGLDPLYVPLSVDTSIFRPVPNAKQVCGLEDDKFVVMMNGMNKGAYHHRKGYPEAFFAFGEFAKKHPDAFLYVHAEMMGPIADGINLVDLAMGRGIPEHQITFCDQYAYMHGFIPPEQLAAVYSAADVLLAPSRGEGFCVPLIEAQACGTPAIVTDFSAQPELVGAGWKVSGEPEWEAALASDYIKASIPQIINALEQAYEERDSDTNRNAAIAKGRAYDTDLVYETMWKPVLAELDGGSPIVLNTKRARIPKTDAVAVLVPVLNRPQNVAPLLESFRATTTGDDAALYFIVDDDDEAELEAIAAAGGQVLPAKRGSTFAKKINAGFEQTSEPWLFVCGDDVRFHDGWIDAARKVSDRFDVIGVSDAKPGEAGNQRVASGGHADHFFIRREYVDEHGGCLGPYVCHEGYRHFYSDVETVELAKARRTFTVAADALVEHMHPDLGRGEVDETYKLGWSAREDDEREWKRRAPLVQMQRTGGRGKVRAA